MAIRVTKEKMKVVRTLRELVDIMKEEGYNTFEVRSMLECPVTEGTIPPGAVCIKFKREEEVNDNDKEE